LPVISRRVSFGQGIHCRDGIFGLPSRQHLFTTGRKSNASFKKMLPSQLVRCCSFQKFLSSNPSILSLPQTKVGAYYD
jgi:hypothetical protein